MTQHGLNAPRDAIAGPCVLWEGRVGESGYGHALYSGRYIGAHRAAWLDAGRPIPKGHHIHHLCRNRLCINVDHLECLTREEHQQRHAPAGLIPLRTIREELGVSIRDLEEQTGIARGVLSMIETGRMNATVAELEQIAAALGIDGHLTSRTMPVWEGEQ